MVLPLTSNINSGIQPLAKRRRRRNADWWKEDQANWPNLKFQPDGLEKWPRCLVECPDKPTVDFESLGLMEKPGTPERYDFFI